MPWTPIVAFMVAAPLTSPEGLVYTAGLFGWPSALAFFLSSIVLGLAGGWLAAILETRGWLARWRVIALVVGILWIGAILSGFAFNLVLMLNMF